MDNGRLGQRRVKKEATIGDLVICLDMARVDPYGHNRRFVGLVLDKSITVYKILVLDSGEDIYWPMDATYLWKETNEY